MDSITDLPEPPVCAVFARRTMRGDWFERSLSAFSEIPAGHAELRSIPGVIGGMRKVWMDGPCK